jgi:hypothetical protein
VIVSEVAKNKNDEYYTPSYAIEPIKKYVKEGSVVWCPFDTAQSLFVKEFKDMGCKVIFSHIENGEDFFTMTPPPQVFMYAIICYQSKLFLRKLTNKC